MNKDTPGPSQHGKGRGNKPVAPRNEPSHRREEAHTQASERAKDRESAQSSTRTPSKSTRAPAEEDVREQAPDGAGEQIPRPDRTTL